jgi:hypothetical protein
MQDGQGLRTRIGAEVAPTMAGGVSWIRITMVVHSIERSGLG